MSRTTDRYTIVDYAPGYVSDATLRACLEIIREGDAVVIPDVATLRANTRRLAIAYDGAEVVGVYTIKVPRREYARQVMEHAGATFPPGRAELGYAAITKAHRGKGLSTPLRRAVLDSYHYPLFAVTSNPASIHGLLREGFVQAGLPWNGRRGDPLALYIYEPGKEKNGNPTNPRGHARLSIALSRQSG